MIYVAAPYTNVRDKIKLIERVNAYTVGLINRHYIVYSPLTHNHELAVAYDLPESTETPVNETHSTPSIPYSKSLAVERH
jgi:hypothetical protein